jgi:hypothetical protein
MRGQRRQGTQLSLSQALVELSVGPPQAVWQRAYCILFLEAKDQEERTTRKANDYVQAGQYQVAVREQSCELGSGKRCTCALAAQGGTFLLWSLFIPFVVVN